MTFYDYRWQKGHARFYRVIIQKDLLNDWILTCIWGGRSNRLGNFKHITLKSLEHGFQFVDLMMKRRKQRGYELLTPLGLPSQP